MHTGSHTHNSRLLWTHPWPKNAGESGPAQTNRSRCTHCRIRAEPRGWPPVCAAQVGARFRFSSRWRGRRRELPRTCRSSWGCWRSSGPGWGAWWCCRRSETELFAWGGTPFPLLWSCHRLPCRFRGRNTRQPTAARRESVPLWVSDQHPRWRTQPRLRTVRFRPAPQVCSRWVGQNPKPCLRYIQPGLLRPCCSRQGPWRLAQQRRRRCNRSGTSSHVSQWSLDPLVWRIADQLQAYVCRKWFRTPHA